MPSSKDLPRATYLVLLALADRARHGLGIVEDVEAATAGTVKLGPGTLYGTLQKMVTTGLVRATHDVPDPDNNDPRRRYYRLTPKGQRALADETDRMQTLVSIAARKRAQTET